MAGLDGDWAALAQVVRSRRLELGIPTQGAAADLADISKNTWQRLENGKQVSLSSLNSVAHALRWHPSYPVAVLEQGVDAPKNVVVSATAALAATAHANAQGVTTKPDREVSLEDSAGAQDENAVARPDAGRTDAVIPGRAASIRMHAGRGAVTTGQFNITLPPVAAHGTGRVFAPVVPVSEDTGFITIPIPVPLDVADDLTDDDLSWLFQWVQQQGAALAMTLVNTKRAERARQGFESQSEWPGMNVNTDQGDEPEDDR